MPSWKTHLLIGFLIAILCINFAKDFLADYYLIGFLILFSSLASVFPDIDTSKSNIRTIFSLLISASVTIYLILNWDVNSVFPIILVFLLSYLIVKYFPTKHRGATHRITFSVIFSFLMAAVLWLVFDLFLIEFIVCFGIIEVGYVSHIVADKI